MRDLGVICPRYEIRHLYAPGSVAKVMHQQVEAERSKRVEILESERQRRSVINIAEGKKQRVILASEALRSKQINTMVNGEAEAILIRVHNTAKGFEAVAKKIQ